MARKLWDKIGVNRNYNRFIARRLPTVQHCVRSDLYFLAMKFPVEAQVRNRAYFHVNDRKYLIFKL